MQEHSHLEAGSDQLFFRIGQVCRLTDTKPFTLRYWESEFPSLQPVKSAKGHRLYRREDVQTVLRIKRLLYDEGFTIAGARRYLRDADAAAPQHEAVPEAARDEAEYEAAPDRLRSGHPAAVRGEDLPQPAASPETLPRRSEASVESAADSANHSGSGTHVGAEPEVELEAELCAETDAEVAGPPRAAAHASPNGDARRSNGDEVEPSWRGGAPSRRDAVASQRTDAGSLLTRKLLLDLRDSLRSFLTLLENE